MPAFPPAVYTPPTRVNGQVIDDSHMNGVQTAVAETQTELLAHEANNAVHGGGAFLPLAGGTMTGDLLLGGADLTERYVAWGSGTSERWRLGIKDTEADTPNNDLGSDLALQGYWGSDSTWHTFLWFDRNSLEAHVNGQNFGSAFWFDEPSANSVGISMKVVGESWERLRIFPQKIAFGDGSSSYPQTLLGLGSRTGHLRVYLDTTSAVVFDAYGGGNYHARFGQHVSATNAVGLTHNTWYDNTNWQRDDVAKVSARLVAQDGVLTYDTAAAAANPIANWTNRLTLDAAGALTLAGDLTINEATPTVSLKQAADTQPRAQLHQLGLAFGPGGSTAPDVTLSRGGVITLQSNSHFWPTSTGTFDLGNTIARWRKLWVTDIDLSGTLTGLTLSYLPLAGGTLTGDLTVSEATPTVNLKQAADAGYRSQLSDSRLVFGPGDGTNDAGLNRGSAGNLNVTGNLNPGGTNDLGAGALRWRTLYAAAVDATGKGTFLPSSGDALLLGGNVAPSAANAYDFGGSSLRWRALYVQAVDAAGKGTFVPSSGDALLLGGNVAPNSGSAYDFGGSALRWRTLYVENINAAQYLQLGNNPATAGLIRATYDYGFEWKNSDGSANAFYKFGVGPNQFVWGYGGVGKLFLDGPTGNLGLTAVPPAFHPARIGLRISDSGILFGGPGYNALEVRCNSYQDASNQPRAVVAGQAGALALVNDTLTFSNAAYVGAGALQTVVPRLAINSAGQVALTPDAGTAAVSIGGTAQPKISVQSGAPSSPMTGDVWMW